MRNNLIVVLLMTSFLSPLTGCVEEQDSFSIEINGYEGFIYLHEIEVDNSDSGDIIEFSAWIEQGYAREFSEENKCSASVDLSSQDAEVFFVGEKCSIGSVDPINQNRISFQQCVSEINRAYEYDIDYDLDEGCTYSEGNEYSNWGHSASWMKGYCNTNGEEISSIIGVVGSDGRKSSKSIQLTGLRDGGGENYNARIYWSYQIEVSITCVI